MNYVCVYKIYCYKKKTSNTPNKKKKTAILMTPTAELSPLNSAVSFLFSNT